MEKKASLAEKEANLPEKEASLAEKETNLETLRHSLEQTSTPLVNKSVTKYEDALAATDDIVKHAEKNNITIAAWSLDDTSIVYKTRRYYNIRHSLIAEGKVDDLVDYLEDLIHAPTIADVVPVVQSMDMAKVGEVEGEEEEYIWRMELSLTVAYQ